MRRSPIRVIVVDDFEPWRRRICAMLRMPDLEVVGEASDGLEAVQKAQEQQPDLILLDIGLPKMSGIEAAQHIRKLSPCSNIVFVTEHRALETVEEALRAGEGYVIKAYASRELLQAVNTVRQARQFVSSAIAGHSIASAMDLQTTEDDRIGKAEAIREKTLSVSRRHLAGFYSDEQRMLNDLTLFIGPSLGTGNAAIVIATESHRDSLLTRLQAYGVDMSVAIEQGRYVALDAADTLSSVMADAMLDASKFMKAFSTLIGTMRTAKHPRIAVCGECAHILWSQGNTAAAMEMEKLGNKLAKSFGVNILCAYSLGNRRQEMDTRTLQQISAEHSVVHYR